MALKKTITIKGGHSAEYWKIKEMAHDTVNDFVKAEVAIYKDKATRDADKKNWSDVRQYTLPLEAFSEVELKKVDKSGLVVGYTELKKLTDLEGAIDA